MKSRFAAAIATFGVVLALAAPARADVLLTPFIGGLFSGDLPQSKAAYGVSLAAMGAGILGGEVDMSWAPKFVDETALNGAVRELNVTGNVIVGIPVGGTNGPMVRPYAVGGIGFIRASQDEGALVIGKLQTTDFAWDLGGGVMGTLNDHFGLRGDLRYFRTTSNENRYRFWRGTGGLVIKF